MQNKIYILIACLLLSCYAKATVWEVSTVAELTNAVNNSVSGDSIIVAGGQTYNMTGSSGYNVPLLTLKAGVSLIGSGSEPPVLTRSNGDGSIFMVNNDTVVIENIIMQSPLTGWLDGAAITVSGADAVLVMSNCTVRNSKADNRGGAIFVGNNSTAIISNCEFYNCSAQNGAAIYVNNSNLYISDSKIHGNNGQNGGGFYLNASYAKVYNCNIYENKVTSDAKGGAAYLTNNSTMELEASIISKNQSSNGGSGFYMNGGNTLRLINCTMAGNVNDNWAAGGIAGNSQCIIEIINSVVTGNTTVSDEDGNISDDVEFDADNSIIGEDLIVSNDPEADCQPSCIYENIIDTNNINIGDSGQVTVTIPTTVVNPETGDTVTIPVNTDEDGNPTIGSGNVTVQHPPIATLIITDSVACINDSITFTITLQYFEGTVTYKLYKVDSVETLLTENANNKGNFVFGIKPSTASAAQYLCKIYNGNNLLVESNSITLFVMPPTTSTSINHIQNTAIP